MYFNVVEPMKRYTFIVCLHLLDAVFRSTDFRSGIRISITPSEAKHILGQVVDVTFWPGYSLPESGSGGAQIYVVG